MYWMRFRWVGRYFHDRSGMSVQIHIFMGGNERPGVLRRSLFRRVGRYFHDQLFFLYILFNTILFKKNR